LTLTALNAATYGFTSANIKAMFLGLQFQPYIYNIWNNMTNAIYLSFPGNNIGSYTVNLTDTTGLLNYACTVLTNNQEAFCFNVPTAVTIVNITIYKNTDVIM